ncbi:MAG: DNA (cytosine-5-)-methyltransferase [Deltaproteobacteria bacterium]
MKVAGLFAGIGGIELGMRRAGHRAELLCEFDESAARVLRHHFDVPLHPDVRDLQASKIPPVDVLAGGFPCQDLSQAGRTQGIEGEKSGLVSHMFRLMRTMKPRPKWVLIENVPFMLQLERGRAMRFLTDTLSDMGYTWCYRVVDTRAFGLPQRRRRVILLASQTEDPRTVLFADEEGERAFDEDKRIAYGFYWTEGIRGLGWGINAIPTLKGGSTVGIPSPPAVWLPNGDIVTPELVDAERLQGFPRNWTRPAVEDSKRRNGPRWKLAGNAVSVPVARWVGQRLGKPAAPITKIYEPIPAGARWPVAAWGRQGRAYRAPELTEWPKCYAYKDLHTFLGAGRLLSLRATEGFRKRTKRSTLRFRDDFLAALDEHIIRMSGENENRRAAAG